MGRNEAASVNLDLSIFANEAKLHRKPEQPRHARGVFLVLGGGGDLSVVLEEISEDRIGVKWDVAEHIVKNVWLRQVVELRTLSYRDRRRKFS